MSKKLSKPAAIILILTVTALVVSMCLGIIASEEKEAPLIYADADQSYAKDELISLYESGVIQGEIKGNGIYLYPQSAVSRGEFVETLVRFFGLSVGRYTEEYITYPDYSTLSQGVKDALSALSYYALTDGVFPLSGDFSEGRSVSRLEAALCIGKLVSGAGLDFDFADVGEISKSVLAQISGLLEKKIIVGFPDGRLILESDLSKEQFALILARFRSYTEKSKN